LLNRSTAIAEPFTHRLAAHDRTAAPALTEPYLTVRNLADYRSPKTGIRSSGWKEALQAFPDLLRRTNPDPMTATITYTDGRTLPALRDRLF
jgi:hypothetical protein